MTQALTPVTAIIDGQERTFRLKMKGLREITAKMQQDAAIREALEEAAAGSADGVRPELLDTLAFMVAMMVRHDGPGGIPDATPELIMEITEAHEIPAIMEAVSRVQGVGDVGKATPPG